MTRIGTLALTLAITWLFGCGESKEVEPASGRDDLFRAEQADANANADSNDQGEGLPPGGAEDAEPVYQTEDEARATDLKLIADANSWTLEEAQTYQDKTEAVGNVAQQVAEQRPQQFVGAAVGPEPSAAPRLFIKGSADEWLQALVAAAPFEIRIVDGQPYSSVELQERSAQLSQALLGLGFRDFGVAARIEKEGLLEAIVQRTSGAPSSTAAIFARLPVEFGTGVSITLVD